MLHGMGWLLYIVLVIYVSNYQGVDFVVGHPSIHIFAQAAIFYLNYCYLVPSLLPGKKLPRFLLLNVLGITMLVVVFIPAYHWLRNWYIGPSAAPFPLLYSEQFSLRSFELLLFVLIACVVRFTVDWFSFQQKTRDLENSQLKTELAFLRSQLNPHFLFNTLNSLYALAIRRSPDTPDGIMQLSQLMRYALYETNEERVNLSKELEMITNFVELQKLRLPLDFPVHFVVKGKVDQVWIEPFLMMPLIENMFKHGAEFASISVSVDACSLTLLTSNGIQLPVGNGPGGIGLDNLQRRLSHLYPGTHQFYFGKTQDHFDTHLSLTINLQS
ncbi:sensor histidine kinase [Dyadobacter soli]|nr:sensor histidine kinase [Dyadobacter soli]